MNWAVALLWLNAALAAAEDESSEDNESSGWQLRAAELQWSKDGRFTGRDVWVTRCGCEKPPWALRAESVTGQVGEEVRLQGGALEVCGRSVLPIPKAVIPLKERRSGLRFPELGYTGDAWRVAQPVFFAIGQPLDLSVTPEWRSSGSVRVLTDAVVRTDLGPDVALVSAVGQDEITRGMVGGRGALGLGSMFASMDSTWISDPRYISDYGTAFLDRSVPWTESLIAAGVGPVRLESDIFGRTRPDADPLSSRPVAGVLHFAGQPIGPVSLSAGTRVDMVDPAQAGLGRAERFASVVGLSGGQEIGPAALQARLEGRSTRWDGADAWYEGRASAATRVGLWGDVSGIRHVADIGVEGSVARTAGTPDLRFFDDDLALPWMAGPALRSHWLTSSGVPVALEASLPWTPEGLLPSGEGRFQLSRWGGRLAGNAQLQEARAWWDDERLSLELGAVRAGTVFQGQEAISWVLPPPAGAWRPGWRGLQELSTGQFLSQGPTLTYDSPCDCLQVQAAGAWSKDRDLPEFWVHLSLR